MLRLMLCTVSLCFVSAVTEAQPPQGLDELKWLIGEWRGVGQGDPGTSGAERHIESSLDAQYIRVEGRSVYPKQEKNPKGEIHAEVDIWSYDRARQTIVLRQFDTLGFACTYVLDKVASSTDRWVLIAESLENVPKGWKARYTYAHPSPNEYHEMLELDPDGKGFQPYVTNRFLRVSVQ